MPAAVLFDLGNTLAAYYHANEFRPILAKSIAAVRDELARRGLCRVPLESAINAAIAENREAADYRFAPMIDRLERIFQVPLAAEPLLATKVCKRFLEPIFAVGRVYGDTLPALAQLRGRGVRTAIVSNAPWGSPPEMWRHELDRLGLSGAIGSLPAECVFVGDDLRWDIEGSASVGMRPLLIDRDARHPEYAGARVTDLHGVLAALDADA